MNPASRVRIKICCIMSLQEADLAVREGASALGLVGEMPSGPGVIPDARIAEIARSIPPSVSSFLLTSERTAEAIASHHRRVCTSTIQIVDALDHGEYVQLRKELPAIKLVQVVHVRDTGAIEEAISLEGSVDALLLDSGRPEAHVKELGGTGRTHDWRISRRICDEVRIPVFLAGGLNAENVREAIERVRPFGVDVCTGVRTGGSLDPVRLHAFIRAASGQLTGID